MILLCCLSKVHPDILISHEFPKSLVCTLPTEDCWNNKCSSCKDGKFCNFDLETASLLNWFQWEKRTNINTNKEHLQKVEQTGSFREDFEKLKKQIRSFILHQYIKQRQSTAYLEHKKESEEGESNVLVLKIDFAENFSTFYQDEIQCAHWNKTNHHVYSCSLTERRVFIGCCNFQ